MIRYVLILTLILPVLLYGQGDLSEKVNEELRPAKLPKNSWTDTTLGWSTFFQIHQKKNVAKYFQCTGAYHLYEYTIVKNRDETLQLDGVIYLDPNGTCYSNIDSLVRQISGLSVQLNYSVIYDASFNILQMNHRLPDLSKPQELLLEAHENYIWEEMQYGSWLIEVRDSIIHNGGLPIQDFSLSPIAQAYNDSILDLIDLDGKLTKERNDSLEQLFISNHKTEIDSCNGFYQDGQIGAIQNCRDCHTNLFKKYGFRNESTRLSELNQELQELANEINKLIAVADQAFEQKDWGKALNYYQKALKIDNTSKYFFDQIKKIEQQAKP